MTVARRKSPKRRPARRNSMDRDASSLTASERAGLAEFAAEHGRTWKSKILKMRATSSAFPMNYPDAYRAFQKIGPSGIRAYRVTKANSAPTRDRRFVVELRDAERGKGSGGGWRTYDTWAKGSSVADVRRAIGNRFPDLDDDEIRITPIADTKANSARRGVRRNAGPSAAPKRQSKTVEVIILQGNYGYGHGWEDESSYDKSDIKGARADLKEYRASGSGGAHRLIRRRVPR